MVSKPKFDKIMHLRQARGISAKKRPSSPIPVEEEHKVQTPLKGRDPILQARSLSPRGQASIGVSGASIPGVTGNGMPTGNYAGSGSGSGNGAIAGILREPSRLPSPAPASVGPFNFDVVKDEPEETRRVSWEPSVKGGHGCTGGESFSVTKMMENLGNVTLRAASRLDDTAQRLGKGLEGMGMKCHGGGCHTGSRFLCMACSDNLEKAGDENRCSRCGINDGLGGGLFVSEEDLLAYQEGRENNAAMREAIRESREAVRESRDCVEDTKHVMGECREAIAQSNELTLKAQEEMMMARDAKALQQAYFKSTSLRDSANNIETGVGSNMSAEEDPFSASMHRYQSGTGAPTTPDSILAMHRNASNAPSPRASTRASGRRSKDKYRHMHFTTRAASYHRSDAENAPSNVPRRKKKNISRLFVKPIKFVATGVKGHLKHGRHKRLLAIKG